MKSLAVKNKNYIFPIFLPDATLGVVRALSSEQVLETGIEGVVINTYHLMSNPGFPTLEKAGGIQNFMNWHQLTASDSGGFQLFSLIQRYAKLGKVTDEGVVLYSSERQRRKTLFTPENSIQAQFAINSDIMICLDDFSPVAATKQRLVESVERTLAWAIRCKKEFEKQCKKRKLASKNRPLLFAVVQGHRDPALRKQSAEELVKIGFDGYGFGGWPFDDNGDFDYEIAQITADVTPNDKPRFALGVGTPENIVRLRQMGYDIFDCVLPTRDARHKRLYIFKQDPTKFDLPSSKQWYEYLYLDRGRLAQDFSPVSQYCACTTCSNYSRAYLHHLFTIQDPLAFQLAITHNLHFYAQVIKKLREAENKL